MHVAILTQCSLELTATVCCDCKMSRAHAHPCDPLAMSCKFQGDFFLWSPVEQVRVAQATLQDISPDAWASTKDTYISGVSQAANVDAKWVHVTGVSKTAPLIVDTQARHSTLSALLLVGSFLHCQA